MPGEGEITEKFNLDVILIHLVIIRKFSDF